MSLQWWDSGNEGLGLGPYTKPGIRETQQSASRMELIFFF